MTSWLRPHRQPHRRRPVLGPPRRPPPLRRHGLRGLGRRGLAHGGRYAAGLHADRVVLRIPRVTPSKAWQPSFCVSPLHQNCCNSLLDANVRVVLQFQQPPQNAFREHGDVTVVEGLQLTVVHQNLWLLVLCEPRDRASKPFILAGHRCVHLDALANLQCLLEPPAHLPQRVDREIPHGGALVIQPRGQCRHHLPVSPRCHPL
mmetsp:Transcript_68893/g.224490  ORF Transcript_68893/g.224490 Transcript_68893/m.224490 type:complete len:203 (+) Transcript_68893:418-1026(+)